MKGLLLKDFYSILGLKNALYVLVVAVIFSAFTDASFICSYIPMMLMMMAISSFSYDEYYKWDSYALLMPLKRKTVISSKYVMIILLAALSIAVSLLMSAVLSLMQGELDLLETLIGALSSTTIFLVIYSFVIPVVVYYGAEKGRYAYIGIIVCLVLIVLAINRIYPLTNIIVFLSAESGLLMALLPLTGIVLLYLSYLISLHLYSKKEF